MRNNSWDCTAKFRASTKQKSSLSGAIEWRRRLLVQPDETSAQKASFKLKFDRDGAGVPDKFILSVLLIVVLDSPCSLKEVIAKRNSSSCKCSRWECGKNSFLRFPLSSWFSLFFSDPRCCARSGRKRGWEKKKKKRNGSVRRNEVSGRIWNAPTENGKKHPSSFYFRGSTSQTLLDLGFIRASSLSFCTFLFSRWTSTSVLQYLTPRLDRGPSLTNMV